MTHLPWYPDPALALDVPKASSKEPSLHTLVQGPRLPPLPEMSSALWDPGPTATCNQRAVPLSHKAPCCSPPLRLTPQDASQGGM